MHKDRLILLLLLTGFMLLGAECQSPFSDDDEDKDPLPDRAFASSGLLRAYYDMRTMPTNMRELKIPEGDDFDDDHLTVEYEMGGAATVTEVRTHFYLMPPKGVNLDDVELIARCIHPDDTASAWKPVDAATSSTFDPQMEVSFLFEFDGKISDGTWKIQIKDYLEDNDGRCLFRNGSLHINRGEAAGLGGTPNETQSIADNDPNARYGPIPEERGVREPFDVGHFGVNRMLLNEFTFTNSFFVQTIQLSFGLFIQDGNETDTDDVIMIVAPSGNWLAFGVGDPADTVDLDPDALNFYDITIGSSVVNTLLMNLNGEPSAGTWSVYFVDTKKDSNVAILTSDQASTSAIVTGGAPITMTLTGVS